MDFKKLYLWIDDFANLFFPNEGLTNLQRTFVVIAVLIFIAAAFAIG